MLQKVKGIVLHSVKYGESNIIAEIYTQNIGRQSFMIYGVRKKNSKVNSYLFQPFTILEFEADLKENRHIQTIREVKANPLINNIYFDIRRSTIAQFISEILHRAVRSGEPDLNLYNYIFHSILLLDTAENGIENFHLIFLLQLTKFLGIYPENGFKLYNQQEADKFGKQLIEFSLAELPILNIDYLSRQNMLDMVLNYYAEHLIGIGQIKSLKILREVFQK